MRSASALVAAMGFTVALVAQLVFNDVPGLFVAPAIAPVAAVVARRTGATVWAGCGACVAAGAGYLLARLIEGALFVSYGSIADFGAILLVPISCVVCALVYLVVPKAKSGR